VDTFMKRVGEIFEVVVFTASLAKVPPPHATHRTTTSKPRHATPSVRD
jgi:TFIIF-interacting CTD phosphatase-like protein